MKHLCYVTVTLLSRKLQLTYMLHVTLLAGNIQTVRKITKTSGSNCRSKNVVIIEILHKKRNIKEIKRNRRKSQ